MEGLCLWQGRPKPKETKSDLSVYVILIAWMNEACVLMVWGSPRWMDGGPLFTPHFFFYMRNNTNIYVYILAS